MIISQVKEYLDINPNQKEILRYAKAKEASQEIEKLLLTCIESSKAVIKPKVCFTIVDICKQPDWLYLDNIKITSKDLLGYFSKAQKAVVFVATLGLSFDMLLHKEERLSITKGCLYQATGAELIECVCDKFCMDMKNENPDYFLRPRFSPGFGDADLLIQRDIFNYLNCGSSIGVKLNESLIMTPVKSVSGFIAMEKII